jgi:hypothetical protein
MVDRACVGGGDTSRDMDGRRERGIVVGSGDGNSPTAGKRGGQLIRRWGWLAGLKDRNSSDRKDEEDTENDVLGEAALGAVSLGSREIRTNTPLASLGRRQGSTWAFF